MNNKSVLCNKGMRCMLCDKLVDKFSYIVIDSDSICVVCLLNKKDLKISEYRCVNKLSYFAYKSEEGSEWQMDEEILILEGMGDLGFGNWKEIADFININSSNSMKKTG